MVNIIFFQYVDEVGNKWSLLKQNISNETVLTKAPSFFYYNAPITFDYFCNIISYYRQKHNNTNVHFFLWRYPNLPLRNYTRWTHNTRWDSSVRVISPTQRPLPDNTQQSQKKDIHSPGEIRTRSPSKRAAADPRLKHHCSLGSATDMYRLTKYRHVSNILLLWEY